MIVVDSTVYPEMQQNTHTLYAHTQRSVQYTQSNIYYIKFISVCKLRIEEQ